VVGVDGSESARQAGALRAGGGAHTQRTPLSGFRVGHPAAILVEEIANADLLVGSRGLGGFRGLLLRSVSQQCAEHAGCVILRAESARHMTDSVET
jgi:nucleotide-binding universal stress UspA family protein